MIGLRLLAAVVLLTTTGTADVAAQGLGGYASVMFDAVPGEGAGELRTRVFAERRVGVGGRLRLTAAGFAEGLVAERGRHGVTSAGIVRPLELHAEVIWARADLRVGLTRVVWGRLDEFQPTDVVNPLDLTRFFLEGRSEARLPVAMVRARLLPSDRFTLEAVYVPVFRRGRFDQLGEATSPFNLAPSIPVVDGEPSRRLGNAQGGVRLSATTGRVDWSVSSYRGFEPLPIYELRGSSLTERFPRFTMVGADFETVYGQWGVRGEVAARDQSFEAGAGADRTAGAYRVAAAVIVSHRTASELVPGDETDTTLVATLDRSFARETRRLRAFAVYNPADDSAFARVIASFSPRDDVTVEASGGVFAGGGADVLSLLDTRDFVYLRLKVFF